MVVREVSKDPFYVKVDGKWVYIDEETLRAHPGASAITTYRDKEASTVFHTFHAGSKWAYKWVTELKEKTDQSYSVKEVTDSLIPGYDDINMGTYTIPKAEADQIAKSFDKLRIKVRRDGLMESSYLFYARKVLEGMGLIGIGFFLQYHGYYLMSALFMGLAWQQLGWMVHECAHHQVFKNPWHNDLLSYFVGDFLQGFSASGWKEQHNIHHAATNVLGRDGDLDLMPYFATMCQDLKLADNWLLNMLPYQHLYWFIGLPFLRLSWLVQSVSFVGSMHNHFYTCYQVRASYEQVALSLHWLWVFAQLYFLPDTQTRLAFFFVSQLFGGFLLAHVVTYNHYSTDKFPYNSAILENYPCLQLYTTRNMRPSMFIDWLWGGLNYQIEHHLFPTMPRHNLNTVMPQVKEFCKENKIPYMVDDLFTGHTLVVGQLAKVGAMARKLKNKML